PPPRSTTTMRSTPARARWSATLQPTTPPPTTRTSQLTVDGAKLPPGPCATTGRPQAPGTRGDPGLRRRPMRAVTRQSSNQDGRVQAARCYRAARARAARVARRKPPDRHLVPRRLPDRRGHAARLREEDHSDRRRRHAGGGHGPREGPPPDEGPRLGGRGLPAADAPLGGPDPRPVRPGEPRAHPAVRGPPRRRGGEAVGQHAR